MEPGLDLGRIGLWTFALDQVPATLARERIGEIEAQGWGAVWIPEAVGRDPLVHATLLLDATTTITVATGIAGIYSRDAMAMNAGWRTLTEAFPDRFVLGLGVSHQPMVEGLRGSAYQPPLTAMREYLERMDASIFAAAEPTATPRRVLAALGPRMLELARERADGAHPYLITPAHTAQAREILGPDRLLAPEQKVVLETDRDKALEVARAALAIYIPGLPNYVNNLRRLGFGDDDLGDPPSDRLVEAVVAWGDVDAIAARVAEHHAAGADHVALQVLPYDDRERVMRDVRTIGDALL